MRITARMHAERGALRAVAQALHARSGEAMSLPGRFARQNLSGYVREHLALIDQMVDRGVGYPVLLELLVAAGFATVSRTALASALHRARHRRPLRGA